LRLPPATPILVYELAAAFEQFDERSACSSADSRVTVSEKPVLECIAFPYPVLTAMNFISVRAPARTSYLLMGGRGGRLRGARSLVANRPGREFRYSAINFSFHAIADNEAAKTLANAFSFSNAPDRDPACANDARSMPIPTCWKKTTAIGKFD